MNRSDVTYYILYVFAWLTRIESVVCDNNSTSLILVYNVYRLSFVPVASLFQLLLGDVNFVERRFSSKGERKSWTTAREKIAAAATRCYQIPSLGCNARCKPPTETTGRPGHGCCLVRKTRVREREGQTYGGTWETWAAGRLAWPCERWND